MSDLARIEIDREVVEAATRRAAEAGLTVTAYVSLLLRRSFERASDEECVLVYDHIGDSGEVHIDREPGEDDETYDQRSALYGTLFDRRD